MSEKKIKDKESDLKKICCAECIRTLCTRIIEMVESTESIFDLEQFAMNELERANAYLDSAFSF